MKTQILKKSEINKAAEIIKSGGLVAFPTETVYGLGANAFNSDAVKKIFAAKKRPADNPLIVHVLSLKQAEKCAYLNKNAKKLIDKFWPGPLTIVLRKKAIVPREVTASLNNIAIRMPRNKIALELIEKSNCPIAAPSANLAGKPSSTCFKHVQDDLSGRINAIIKSEDCEIGIESTVINLTSKQPILLRPGKITLEQLRKILPNLKIANNTSERPSSPGMKYKHYSPKAKVILFERNISKINYYRKKYERYGKKVRVLQIKNLKKSSKKLFKTFRKLDEEKTDYILVLGCPEKGIGLALMNRLKKAAHRIIL